MTENEIGTLILNSAIKVHQQLGPGLLESVYEVALASEILSNNLHVERQVKIPIVYNQIEFDECYKAEI